MATDVMPNTFHVEHIGPTPHILRNAMIALGVFIMAGLMLLFYRYTGHEESAAAVELGQFRQAMWNRCGGDQFAGNTDPMLAQLYGDSSRMRQAVEQQYRVLQRANVDCEDVLKALRSADYPVRQSTPR